MKNPDEIKKGLEHCSTKKPCTSCPMWEECKKASSLKPLWDNALAYIQQLEAANAELLTKVEQLTAKCHQLEQERDAAVGDIPRACGYCKWFEVNLGGNMTECHNPNGCRNISGINTGWQWRGVKEE